MLCLNFSLKYNTVIKHFLKTCYFMDVYYFIVSVQFSRSVVSDSLQPCEPEHRPPCPSSTPGVYPDSCPLSRWCHPTISFSVVPFSSCPQSAAAAAKSLQSCPTLCDPMDCSLPGFSVHGILQARTLEWVAISFPNFNDVGTKHEIHIQITLAQSLPS